MNNWSKVQNLYKHVFAHNFLNIYRIFNLEKVLESWDCVWIKHSWPVYESQYGFRSNTACKTAIGELIGSIVQNLEHKKSTLSVFLDLSKAFDTLSHKILLSKLESYGIRGSTLNWFENYLVNRTLRAKCNTTYEEKPQYSSYFPIEYGAPQGSCLGPLLFLIFANDLYHVLQHTSCILFADDTTIYHSHKNLRHLKWIIEKHLKQLMDWFKANKLTLNLNKTECMLFSPKGLRHSQMVTTKPTGVGT